MDAISVQHAFIKIDKFCEKIPIASTVINLINIFIKSLLNFVSADFISNNHYYSHLNDKKLFRCIVLLIPFIGNAFILIYDRLTIDSKIINGPVVPKDSYRPENRSLQSFRTEIFHETLGACERGYINRKGQRVDIDHEAMLTETESFGDREKLEAPIVSYNTIFSVTEEDTLDALIRIKQEGGDPVGINMANAFKAGGGVDSGCSAQEEAICRRSNHILGLQTQNYPLSEKGGIYCPHVQVFRENEQRGFGFFDEPQEVAFVAVAAYDLRPLRNGQTGDRDRFRFPRTGALDPNELMKCREYVDGTKDKIRNLLRTMALKNHTQIVLGALGCGAFENPPIIISQLFQEIFNEVEFKGRFERVNFAILRLSDRDQANINLFTTMCNTFN